MRQAAAFFLILLLTLQGGFAAPAISRSVSQSQQNHVFEGEWTIPVILVDFPDRPFTKTKEEFEEIFNGAVRNYFLENSSGKFDLRAVVYGPFTLPNPISFYGSVLRERIGIDAVRAAEQHGFDPTIYPHPLPGFEYDPWTIYGDFIGMHIIFAGYCQSAGVSADEAVWSHAGSWSSLVGGIRHTGRYGASPEFSGRSGTNIGHLGVKVHEIGHSIFHLSDSYGHVSGVVCPGPWCIMSSGSWNFTPARFSAYHRVRLGWASVITLNERAANVILPNPALHDIVYRIDTQTEDEYFLLENRQRIGVDADIPADGMLIYHVRGSSSPWFFWNSDSQNRRYYIKQAGCNLLNGCLRIATRADDVFPRTDGSIIYDSFTDYTVPNSLSWAGEKTSKPITNIRHNTQTRTITFDFMQCLHNLSDWSLSKKNSCLERDELSRFCLIPDCAHTETTLAEIPNQHEWAILELIPSTCVSHGSQIEFCIKDNCGQSGRRSDSPLNLNNHDWHNTVITPATCVLSGSQIEICIRNGCGQTGRRSDIPQLTGSDCETVSIRNKETDSRYGIVIPENPVSDFARISVITPEPAQITLRIMDNLGNVVFTETAADPYGRVGRQGLHFVSNPPLHSSAIIWNLTNTNGRFVANGAYLIIVEATGISGRRFTYSARIGVNR